MADLPPPDADALAHCERVVAHVHQTIQDRGGWLSFRDYMEIVLHAPGLGYYAAGAEKLGVAGDFTTAPEMTPLFGAALAGQVEAILAASQAREIVELGAGTGRLAGSLLAALAERDALPARYLILETSADLRARQAGYLARAHPDLVARVAWLDAPPTTIDGVLLANEVLDAIAVHLLRHADGRWLERGVVATGPRVAPHFGLAFADREAPPALAAVAAARFPGEAEYLSEVNLAAEALVEDLARRLVRGALLFVDYGFAASTYYHPQRATGTLMCHYRHRSHADPLFYPGLSDITAHVDFTAMAAAGRRAGAEVAGFAPQAAFLLGCGILDRLAAVGAPDALPYMKAAAQVQRLLSPAEMGELFKVLALTRDAGIAWPGFTLTAGRHRL